MISGGIGVNEFIKRHFILEAAISNMFQWLTEFVKSFLNFFEIMCPNQTSSS